MENIWSENKYINLTINVLLFLVAINFMHYAQIFVPIICLIILINNKFKFKVNNKIVFIILCLFGLSFLYFDRYEGFFSLIGLFFPMAYYIGSNIIEPSEEKIIKIIYIFTFGMLCHIILNFACDFFIRGLECFSKNSHFDIWTLDEYPTTQTATNYVLIIGIIYYIFVYESNKKIRTLGIISFVISIIYLIALGRRTPIFMLTIVVILSFVLDALVFKNINKYSIIMLILLFIMFAFGVLLFFTYKYNLFGMGSVVEHLGIVRKFISVAFYTPRAELIKNTLLLAPKHLFGGREISQILDLGPHELWLDIFDAAGIIPYIIIVAFSIYCLIVIIKIILDRTYSKSYRLLSSSLLLSITIQLFMEPVLSGTSSILLCIIIIISCLECLQVKREIRYNYSNQEVK